ncbi:MAG: ferrous iron transporter B [Spirochaetales bacterium]|nr:ferrous iron transporter B [Spirochaetales bacterium]
MKTLLLMGNPNVGKSALFARLTGVHVVAANYPGSTVEYTKGYLKIKDERWEVIDVPGTYSLDPTSKAEEVAVRMLSQGDIIINVVDATNLERNLNLSLQLLKKRIPMLMVLNFWDETTHKGIHIDNVKLQHLCGIPVIPTTAVSGEGVKNLVEIIPSAKISSVKYSTKNRWNEIGKIVADVQVLEHKHHTIGELIGEATIKPFPGIPMAAVVLFLSFMLIWWIGESIKAFVMDPLFDFLLGPLLHNLSDVLGSGSVLHNLLIGRLMDGSIDFEASFGILTTGLYVPFAIVLPYIIMFYFVLSLLEDIGYLPRLGILLDRAMHIVGLHGMGFIPMLLALGCNVPGVMALRTIESKKARFISATLMAIAIPCWGQLAVIISMLGRTGPVGFTIYFFTLVVVWLGLGIILKRGVKGESLEIFSEIPPYRIPYIKALFKKVWMRMFHFLKEALPFVFLGIVVVNLLYMSGIIYILGDIASPVLTSLFGLPKETVGALIVGVLRKDVAVGMLVPLGLSFKQVVVASVILTIYFPCMATFLLLLKEIGVKDMLKATAIMIVTFLTVGTVLNIILSLLL